jgi:hypothetical protein
MKIIFSALLYLSLCSALLAQRSYITLTNDSVFGRDVKIFPANDAGWYLFSADSLNLTKINKCGVNEWSRHYIIPNTGNNDIVQTSDYGFAILTVQNTVTSSPLLTRIDQTGNILWSKSFEDAGINQSPYSLSCDSTDNFYIFGDVEFKNDSVFKNSLLKVNTSGNLLWLKFYDHYGNGHAIATCDNGVFAYSGDIIYKTDNNGNILWTNKFSQPFQNGTKPVEVSDGYIFSGTDSMSNILFYKFNLNGNVAWGGIKKTNLYGNAPA